MNTSRPLGTTRDASLTPDLMDDLVGDESGDVPGWVLVTLMTAGLPVIR